METIALFGGSFDPPHIGHIGIVTQLLTIKDIDKVVVMPTYLNPFKSGYHAPAELRLQWLKSIFASSKRVDISSFEVDLQRSVPTIESVKYLLTQYKKIYLVIGADNLNTLCKWANYNELETLVTFIVATRDGIEIPNNFLKLELNEDISSTVLRKNIDIQKIPKISSKEIIKFYKEKNEK